MSVVKDMKQFGMLHTIQSGEHGISVDFVSGNTKLVQEMEGICIRSRPFPTEDSREYYNDLGDDIYASLQNISA